MVPFVIGVLWVTVLGAAATSNSSCTTDTPVTPHPTKCAQYYNCSAPAQNGYWPNHLQECPYPQVFNVNNTRCEHYTMVDCGGREEPLGKCDYRANNCERSHCIPCYVFWASCKGLPDGFNPHVGMEQHSYFAVCVGNRTVYQGSCSQFKLDWFDPVKRKCVLRE